MLTKIDINCIDDIVEMINVDNECFFLAIIGNNFNYLCVNAFIHYLHDELGYKSIHGILVNSRTDPNYGHSFAEDSYRFPKYCSCILTYFKLDNGKSMAYKMKEMLKGVLYLEGKKEKNLYLCMHNFSPFIFGFFSSHLRRKINIVILSSGLEVGISLVNQIKFVYLKLVKHIKRVNILDFRPYDNRMRRNGLVEKYCRKATEDEDLRIIREKEKYVLYVSQSAAYKAYNQVVMDILKDLSRAGYKIYIKPHTHERECSYPRDEDFVILPRSYALESIVAGAEKRPDMIIGFLSNSMFSCSTWFDIPCYLLMNYVDDATLRSPRIKAMMKAADSNDYPYMKIYSKQLWN